MESLCEHAGGLLLARVIAVTFFVTFAASLAARLGPITMAAFQTCQQVWMTSSLLSDGLAVAIQVNAWLILFITFIKQVISCQQIGPVGN